MARIRSVRPEFFSDHDLAAAGNDVRMLFISLWCQADNYGALVDDPREIAAFAFPAIMGFDAARVHGMIQHLEGIGKVVRYDVNGQRYIRIATWEKHQRPKNPGDPRWPQPDGSELDAARARRRSSWERSFSDAPKLPLSGDSQNGRREPGGDNTDALPHEYPTPAGGLTKVEVEGEGEGEGEGTAARAREEEETADEDLEDFEGRLPGGIPAPLIQEVRLRFATPLANVFRANTAWGNGLEIRWTEAIACSAHSGDLALDDVERCMVDETTRPLQTDIHLPAKWLERVHKLLHPPGRGGGRWTGRPESDEERLLPRELEL